MIQKRQADHYRIFYDQIYFQNIFVEYLKHFIAFVAIIEGN